MIEELGKMAPTKPINIIIIGDSDFVLSGCAFDNPESIQEEPKERVDEPWHNQLKKKKRRF
jgi:hypothetical protein